MAGGRGEYFRTGVPRIIGNGIPRVCHVANPGFGGRVPGHCLVKDVSRRWCWKGECGQPQSLVRRLTDTVRMKPKEPEPVSRGDRGGRRRAAQTGRHRAHRERRLVAVPTDRTLPDAAAAASPFVGVGTVLAGRYRLERVLGEGGSATVFGGTDTSPRAAGSGQGVPRPKGEVTAQTRQEREIR